MSTKNIITQLNDIYVWIVEKNSKEHVEKLQDETLKTPFTIDFQEALRCLFSSAIFDIIQNNSGKIWEVGV